MTNHKKKQSTIEKTKAKIIEIYGLQSRYEAGIETEEPALVVDKTAAIAGGFDILPRFVIEFLIAHATTKRRRLRLDKVKQRLAGAIVDANNRRTFISNLMDRGHASLIGNVAFEPSLEKGAHQVHVMQLDGAAKVHVDDELRRQLCDLYPALLSGSVWGDLSLIYVDKTLELSKFQPFQLTMAPRDVERFSEGRENFNTLEWIDLLLTSMGYNPLALETPNLPTDCNATYDIGEKGKPILAPVWTPMVRWDEKKNEYRPLLNDEDQPIFFHKPDVERKLLMLCRLLPLLVKNCHLAEIGPRGTGKTYVLRNLSQRVHVIPAGKVTSAQLLYSNRIGKEKPGILGNYKVAVFDDLGGGRLSTNADNLGYVLRDYMESGQISRGGRIAMSDCSMVFSANIDLAPDGKGPSLPDESWFRVFPMELNDPAILDRLTGVIPGWELPKITNELVTPGVGFLADYFGEMLCISRNNVTIEDFVKTNIEVLARDPAGHPVIPTLRDARAVRKIITGLMNILYPDNITDPIIDPLILGIAVKLRNLVHEQLVKAASGEFKPRTLYCRFRDETTTKQSEIK